MAKNYSRAIAEAINEFLSSDDWKYRFNNSDGVFEFGLNLKGKINNVRYVIAVHEEGYTVYAVSPVSVERNNPEMLNKMAEFICRANYGLRSGNFEMDFRDGEIRYKTYTDCSNITPSTEMVRRSIHIPAAMFDRYADGIVNILFIGGDPAELIKQCEDRKTTPAPTPAAPEPQPEAEAPKAPEAAAEGTTPAEDDSALARTLDFIRSLGSKGDGES